MKVQILSDLHLEFGETELHISGCDLLILAGDVHIGLKGFDWITERIKDIPVLYVPGNHEYYRNSYPGTLNKLRERAKGTNIHVLENESIYLEGICFHGCTLWTDFALFGDPKIAGYECEQRMNDYRLIRLDPSYSRLKTADTCYFHHHSIRWLSESLENSTAKTNVVITHHAPGMNSVPEQYRKDVISAAYASNLENFILETKPDFWIHGHAHEPCDYMIGKTRIICNPKGYPMEPYNGFNPKLVLNLP